MVDQQFVGADNDNRQTEAFSERYLHNGVQ